MPNRLPKPATPAPPARPALLCLWPDRLLFIGQLARVAPHRHAAAVCLVALEGELRVRIPPERQWWTGGSALIPAGCTHALDLRNNLTAVFYNEPHRPYYQRLSAREHHAPAFGLPAEHRLREVLVELYRREQIRQPGGAAELERVLAKALEAYAQAPTLDVRVRQTITRVQEDLTQNRPLPDLAAAVALSSSRLQHLFLAETGVPLRRFRTWTRFRRALERVAVGASFTEAALEAGFASSTHFSHAFKAMFGVSAASVLAGSPAPRILKFD